MEVIIPSFTVIATAHCLQWQKITPVFCDIGPLAQTIDSSQIERLTPRTTGIIGVHVLGSPCRAEALGDIARRYGMALLFDAAQGFRGTYERKGIGNTIMPSFTAFMQPSSSAPSKTMPS